MGRGDGRGKGGVTWKNGIKRVKWLDGLGAAFSFAIQCPA